MGTKMNVDWLHGLIEGLGSEAYFASAAGAPVAAKRLREAAAKITAALEAWDTEYVPRVGDIPAEGTDE